MARNEREKKKVTTLLNRFSTLMTQRRVWEGHWQEIADYMVPRKADITRRHQFLMGAIHLPLRGAAHRVFAWDVDVRIDALV